MLLSLRLCLSFVLCVNVITAEPTLYIAGDSTAAADDGNPALLGWGAKIGNYLSIAVVNDAVSGSTARSFTDQGFCKPVSLLSLYQFDFQI